MIVNAKMTVRSIGIDFLFLCRVKRLEPSQTTTSSSLMALDVVDIKYDFSVLCKGAPNLFKCVSSSSSYDREQYNARDNQDDQEH